MHLDLIGLPPEPVAIDAFAADESSTVYEALVEKLLGSRHHGERLAQAVEIWNRDGVISNADLEIFQRHLLHCDLRGLPVIEDSLALREQSRVQGVSLFHGDLCESPGMTDWYTDLYDAEICFADGELARLWSFFEAQGTATWNAARR